MHVSESIQTTTLRVKPGSSVCSFATLTSCELQADEKNLNPVAVSPSWSHIIRSCEQKVTNHSKTPGECNTWIKRTAYSAEGLCENYEWYQRAGN